jgi:hypothetical protein
MLRDASAADASMPPFRQRAPLSPESQYRRAFDALIASRHAPDESIRHMLWPRYPYGRNSHRRLATRRLRLRQRFTTFRRMRISQEYFVSARLKDTLAGDYTRALTQRALGERAHDSRINSRHDAH